MGSFWPSVSLWNCFRNRAGPARMIFSRCLIIAEPQKVRISEGYNFVPSPIATLPPMLTSVSELLLSSSASSLWLHEQHMWTASLRSFNLPSSVAFFDPTGNIVRELFSSFLVASFSLISFQHSEFVFV